MSSITGLNKKLKSDSKLYWFLREQYVVIYSLLARLTDHPKKPKKKRILFYHIDSLGFAGTEKFMQILAKYLNKDRYDVYYFYPDTFTEKPEAIERLNYVESGQVITIPFDYRGVRKSPPYFVEGMNPDIKKIIKALNIDLFVTAAAGSATYPFSIIKNVPIILLNIFGHPNVQSNIHFHISISKEVAQKLRGIVPENKIRVLPVPSEGPNEKSVENGKRLREKFNIQEDEMVFGRIGRADNGIYDSIGIEAFKIALEKNPRLHYLIMAPPPILIEKVKVEKIPNVHFLESTSDEEEVWAFHAAIDALAHFRNDGESFGLNIVESMLSGKPIITHKSHIWNAHLEYLDSSFARITEKDDIESYAKYLLEFVDKKREGKLKDMGRLAEEKARKLFMIESNIGLFENWIDQALKSHA